MRTTQQFSITLPLEMAEAVEDKVKSGAYASVSEVLRDGVRACWNETPPSSGGSVRKS
jgi:antitoxin ParD1/3/4